MEGLLDFMKTPEGQGLLSMVAGGLATAGQPGRGPLNTIGAAGLAGLQGYSGALERQEQAAQNKQMQEARELQIKTAKLQLQQQEEAAQFLARMSGRGQSAAAQPAAPVTSPVFKPEFNAERQGGAPAVPPWAAEWAASRKSPTAPTAPAAPGGELRDQIIAMANSGNPVLMERAKALAEIHKLNEPKYQTVGDTLVRVDTGKPEQVFQAPPKREAAPSAVREYEYAVSQGYKGSFYQWVQDGNQSKAPRVAVDVRDPTALARAGLDFQNQVRAAFKDDHVIANQFRAMQDAAKNPSAQGDTALLYSFFKVLDPASTVREGELDLVMSSRSIPDKFKGYAQKLANGQTLMPNERLDLLTQAGRQVQARMPRAANEVRAYGENARRLTLDPNLYVPDPYAGITLPSAPGARQSQNGGQGGQRPSLGNIFFGAQ